MTCPKNSATYKTNTACMGTLLVYMNVSKERYKGNLMHILYAVAPIQIPAGVNSSKLF